MDINNGMKSQKSELKSILTNDDSQSLINSGSDINETLFNDELKGKLPDLENLNQHTKEALAYLTTEIGSVSGAVQLFGYENTALAMHILGGEIKPQTEYIT